MTGGIPAIHMQVLIFEKLVEREIYYSITDGAGRAGDHLSRQCYSGLFIRSDPLHGISDPGILLTDRRARSAAEGRTGESRYRGCDNPGGYRNGIAALASPS